MKKIILCMSLIFISVFISSCGDLSDYQNNVGESSLFNTNEMNIAVDVAKDYFWRNFDECKLASVEYNDKVMLNEQASLNKIYGVNYSLKFTFWYYDFKDKTEALLFKEFILGSSDKQHWNVLETGY